MRNQETDWNLRGRAADATEVVITRALRGGNSAQAVTSIEASFDTTASAELQLYGLTKVGVMDMTDVAVVVLASNKFTFAGHGLTNADPVVFHSNGGTAPTGLTSGTSYFVVGVSGADFQLAATVGGGAIALSGTQANFGTKGVILPLSRAWQVYDHLEVDFSAPLRGTSNASMIIKITPPASTQVLVNVSGYDI